MNAPRYPREILLGRHASARPSLDTQRAVLLARFASHAPGSASPDTVSASPARFITEDRFSLLGFFATLHRELFAPYRRAWHALACIWFAIIGLQHLERFSTPAVSSRPTVAVDPAFFALWLEQRRLLAGRVANGVAAPAPLPDREALSPPIEPVEVRPLGFSPPTPRSPASHV